MFITKISTLKENFEGYEVHLGCSEIPFVAFASKSDNVIYVTDLFLNLFTEEEQQAVLAHKVGHLVLHPEEEGNVHTIIQELEADRYAAEIAGVKSMTLAIQKFAYLYKVQYKKGVLDQTLYRERCQEISRRLSNMLDLQRRKTDTLDALNKATYKK